jgi:hypothetical protein
VHNIHDHTTPYNQGVVYLDSIGNIMYVWGSQTIATTLNEYGVNGWLKTTDECFVTPFQLAVDAAADELNGELLGLFPIVPPDTFSSTPWVWYDPANPTDSSNYVTAELYLDSILAFIQPQLFATMQLQELAHCGCVDVTPVPPVEAGLTIVPNPAIDKIEISSDAAKEIRFIRLYDIRGILVKEFEPGNQSHYTVPVEQFAPGVYLVQVQFDDTISTKQIVVQ